ncbi:AAA family ATPase, partial [Streptomyces sp. ISL-11]|uniref:AAA family ATPase n=1 Tax=Streptomyces sp. ISL-11 TaxID=2819174 RepID=UPI001BE92DE3
MSQWRTEDAGQWPVTAGRHGGTAPLVERDREQEVLGTLLRGLASGRSAAVEVHGPPGTGRSALLDRAVELAGRAGVRAATAHASWEEAGLRYGVAGQLLATLAPQAAPRLTADRGDLSLELCRLVLTTAPTRPLLIAVDDAQWADPDSWRWLRALARRLAGAPLLLLTTHGVAAGATPENGSRIELSALADERAVTAHTLTLAPLSPAGVGAMLAGAYGRAVDPAFAQAAARATDGNPAVLRTVIGRFARHGLHPGPDHLPHLADSAAEAVRGRAARTVAALPVELQDVLRAVAVCGQDGPPDMIGALAEPRTMSAARALELLSGTGLLTGGARPAFREPGAAEAVLAGLGAERREELYARAAERAHRAAVPDDGLTRMLLAARVIGSSWAVEALRREAARRRAAHDLPGAARLLQRALREPVPAAPRVRILTELSAAVLPSSPEAADRHLRRALLTPADATAGPSWVLAAELLVARGDVVAAQPLIAHVLDRADLGRRDRAALRALYWLAEHSRQGAAHELDQPSTAPLPDLPAEPAEAAVAAWRRALRGRDLARTRDLAHAALAPLARDTTPLTCQLAACHALILTDDFAGAEAALDAVLVRAEHTGARQIAGLAHLVQALAELHQGRTEAASAALNRAQEAMPPHCWHPLTAPALVGVRTLVLLEQGDLTAAGRTVELARPTGAEDGLAWAYLLYARGRQRLAVGRRDEALADLLECGRVLLTRQVANPTLLPWRSAAALARAQGPDDAGSAELLAEERRLALAWGAPSAVRRVLLAAARPGPD